MDFSFCKNCLYKTSLIIIFLVFFFKGFSQEKDAKQTEGRMEIPNIESFYLEGAFLDSSYDVLKFLSAGKEIPVLSTSDAFKIFKEKLVQFIDARGPDEFAAGHIPGATNIPYDSVSLPKYVDILSKIERDRRIVVYCNTHLCIVSKIGAEGIIFNGFRRVIIAEGYWRWKEMGHPVKTIPLSRRNQK